MTMKSISCWGMFPTPTAAPKGFTEGFHHAVTINQAHERYRKIMFGLRASMPDATEYSMQCLSDAVEGALKSARVKESLEALELCGTIASVAEGVDICV